MALVKDCVQSSWAVLGNERQFTRIGRLLDFKPGTGQIEEQDKAKETWEANRISFTAYA